ncbi:MAG: hypothetical protein JXB48_14365 [Candidatus Latescibacteria bacterium]|nr:hypothetical protein [Candidatus Latescibacterota bacterium]
MKQNKNGYLYVCDNCNHEFYFKKLIENRLIECPRCGEKSAYCDETHHDNEIQIEDKDALDFLSDDIFEDDFEDSEFDNY